MMPCNIKLLRKLGVGSKIYIHGYVAEEANRYVWFFEFSLSIFSLNDAVMFYNLKGITSKKHFEFQVILQFLLMDILFLLAQPIATLCLKVESIFCTFDARFVAKIYAVVVSTHHSDPNIKWRNTNFVTKTAYIQP